MGTVTFDIGAHDAFVQRHSDAFRWYRGSLCPCGATPDANRSRVTCLHCNGTGTRYEAPVIMNGIITGVERYKALLESGFLEPGDLQLGLSPLEPNILSPGDMIEINWTHGQPYEGDVLKRGAGSNVDLLSYPPVDIFSCVSIHPTTQALTSYVSGANFTVSGRALTWISVAPSAGQNYSIKYTALFQWIAFRPPMDRMEQNVSLGQWMFLRKRNLAIKPQV